MTTRSGRFVTQRRGYEDFIPEKLPPDPPVEVSGELLSLLSKADRALARLDGVTFTLPNPDLFVAMYVRQEAVLSSQIEGTQSTLKDVLEYEIDATGREQPRDVQEVVNYVSAMNHGLQRLADLPLSLRLVKEIHEELMTGVRGQNRQPGQFRTTQNWIGPVGGTIEDATFVPPPPHMVTDLLGDLELYLNEDSEYPDLIDCGLAHAQFETIHPFLDGNGRVGRLLVTFILCERQILQQPLLYLSRFLKAHRQEYYDRLTAIRNNDDWEGWLRFFLRGVMHVSAEAVETAQSIVQLRESHLERLQDTYPKSPLAPRVLAYLFRMPIATARTVQENLDCSYTAANQLLQEFEELGLLEETTGKKRYRRYRYTPYLDLFGPSRSVPPWANDQSGRESRDQTTQ